MNRTALTCTAIASLALLAAAALSSRVTAGPLSPPSGPVTPTYKTLSEVEPRTAVSAINTPGAAGVQFVISAPGSYYLTGNLPGAAAKTTITITADDVTLDLNGFEISGVPTSLDAINATASTRGISVRNGTITGFPAGTGIAAISASGGRFADLTIASCGSEGLWAGPDSHLDRITVRACRNGIRTGDRSTIADSTARDCTQRGIDAGSHCTISRCASVGNAGHNIYASAFAVIDRCTANQSTGAHGIACPLYAVVSDCIAVQNFGNGIDVANRSTVHDCTASQNGAHGIHSNYVGLVSRCIAEFNGGCGILCDAGGGVDIVENQCSENGAALAGAGIRVTAGGCRVERNNMDLCRTGIDITGTRNIIVRNSVAASTIADYAIVGGNTFGPMINAAGLGDLAAVAGANHPQANFRY